MLTGLLIGLAIIQRSDPPSAALPDMNHMVREGLVNPKRAIHTVEWSCSKAGKKSRIVISVEDIGIVRKNERFAIKLRELVVSGRAASAQVDRKMRALLASLNNISTFEGRCRQSTPAMLISGHTYEGTMRPPKIYTPVLE